MDKVLYKKVCLGIVLLLLSGEFTAQTLKYVDAQKLLMVGKINYMSSSSQYFEFNSMYPHLGHS